MDVARRGARLVNEKFLHFLKFSTRGTIFFRFSMDPRAAKAASESAVERFKEAAKVAQDRLSHFSTESAREATAGGGLPAQEALASLSWVACMLLSTAEEALRSRQALAAADKQCVCDQLERAQLSLSQSRQDQEALRTERDALREESKQLGSRVRKDGLTTRQRQAKDAARIFALTEQTTQLQASLRLSESAWAEERRAEQVMWTPTPATPPLLLPLLVTRPRPPQLPLPLPLAHPNAHGPVLSARVRAGRPRAPSVSATSSRSLYVCSTISIRLPRRHRHQRGARPRAGAMGTPRRSPRPLTAGRRRRRAPRRRSWRLRVRV